MHLMALCVTCPNGERHFPYPQDLIAWARHHYETTGHNVLVPFKIYERKGE
jgi:hypothetical protein